MLFKDKENLLMENINWEEKLNSFKLLVFDFDGTLVNLNTDWNALRRSYCDLLNIDEKDTNFKNLLSKIKNKKGEETYSHAIEMRTQAETGGFHLSDVNHGLCSYIKTSKKICTIFSMNTEKAIRSILKNLNILDKFDKIIGGDSISPPKPDPMGLKSLVNYYKMNEQDVVMIGDSDIDERCAQSVKTNFIRIFDFSN